MSEHQGPLDRRVARALRAEYAAPRDPRYWRRLEAKVMWRVATTAGDDWVRAFHSWQRVCLAVAAVALATLGLAAWREQATERQLAYETVIESRPALPVQLRDRIIDGSAHDATLRYVYGY